MGERKGAGQTLKCCMWAKRSEIVKGRIAFIDLPLNVTPINLGIGRSPIVLSSCITAVAPRKSCLLRNTLRVPALLFVSLNERSIILNRHAFLWIDSIEGSGEGDGFADVFQAADPGYAALYAHAETRVRDAAVFAEVQVPLEGRHGEVVGFYAGL
jgi:hypothetical protein